MESSKLALECFRYMNYSRSPTDWLLEFIDPKARLFHTGNYCGRWKASSHGHANASFHLIVSGNCWLHLEGVAPEPLTAGDGVLILRDVPFWLSSSEARSALTEIPVTQMQPFTHHSTNETGLVCGFFEVAPGIGQWVIEDLPNFIIFRQSSTSMPQIPVIFSLIVEETQREQSPSPSLLTRLSDLLLLYVLRERLQHLDELGGVFALVSSTTLLPLLERLVAEPDAAWTLQTMADTVGMSRSAFFKHFNDCTGQSPGQVLLMLRMKMAERHLHNNRSVIEAADLVGYKSLAAFTRAFSRFYGEAPGAFRRHAKQLSA